MSSLTVFMLSYLAGSVPWGFVIGRFKGLDIRNHGSGNIGATNVRRVLGRDWGAVCLALDFLKGLLPVLLIGAKLGAGMSLSPDWGKILAAAGAVGGHVSAVRPSRSTARSSARLSAGFWCWSV